MSRSFTIFNTSRGRDIIIHSTHTKTMSFLLRNVQQVLLSTEQNLKLFRELVNHSFHKNGCDITYDQWTVLTAIKDQQGITQSTLAQKAHKEPASISRILKLLAQKEMIEKVNDKKSKRAKRIYLTPHGDESQKKATVLFNRIAKEGFNGVYEQEINLYVRIIDKIESNFDKMIERKRQGTKILPK